jgi:plasmid segregation protein ParM
MRIVGLDIGYSNLKIAFGTQGENPRVVVRPAGAAPASMIGMRIQERADGVNGNAAVMVEIDGQPWVAGIEPSRYESGWTRTQHEDYASTPTYLALAMAGLVLSRQSQVDILVTGLPVSQASDRHRREALMRTLTGVHRVSDRHIVVGEVRVVPQPVGAYVDLVSSVTDPDVIERIEEGAVLVLDAGYYSVDWALIVAGELRRSASGTSLEGMGVLLDDAAKRIAEEAGGKPNPAALEAAVRAGKSSIVHAGQRYCVPDLLARSARQVTASALEAMRMALRREVASIDVVLLAGGGGDLYGVDIQDLYPGARICRPESPVAANAMGYFRHASH